MKKFLIAGLINIETTVGITEFPIAYTPLEFNFFGIESTVSGVGFNVAKALKTLGAETQLLSLIGDDIYKDLILNELIKEKIDTNYIKPIIQGTAQSIVMYDADGKRKIYLDLKDIQDCVYPKDKMQSYLSSVDMAVLCNINFARGLLEQAKKANKIIATDVHIVDNIEDSFNKDFMTYADILFLSNEKIMGREATFIKDLAKRYDNKIIVVGMGANGALLYTKSNQKILQVPAVNTRKIVSTIGAGDALFSAFVHFYSQGIDPITALKNAVVFASYKIGEKGASSGFLTEEELLKLRKQV